MSKNQAGFSLVEVLVALFLISIGVLAAAPLFIYAAHENETGAGLGLVSAVAVEHLERLRSEPFNSLVAGGSLDANDAGYSDTTDPDIVVRWTIADNGAPTETKTIRLRAIARNQLRGPRKEVTMTTVRGL